MNLLVSSMKEYSIENGLVDRERLTSRSMPLERYEQTHKGTVIVCHDVFVQYHKGILLVRRENEPAKGFLWPLGGRIQRGLTLSESLEKRVRKESNLELGEVVELGIARTYFQTDPFHHGKGTDSIIIVHWARGYGELKLDKLHSHPHILTKKVYDNVRGNLHPYVVDFMDIIYRQKPLNR